MMKQVDRNDMPEQQLAAEPDRHAEIVKAAALVIHRQGYDATSMNDIADAVNLTKAGLYYYTRGKQDLLYMIIDWGMDLVEREVLQRCRTIPDPEERLTQIVRRHMDCTMVDGGAVTILTVEVDKLADAERAEITQRHRIYLHFVRDTLQELKDKGRLRITDPTIGALNMFATLLGLPRWYHTDGHLSREDITREISDYVLGALLRD